MIDALVIVLREALEASLLISFLFILSDYYNLNKRWVFFSLAVGVVFAISIASKFSDISELFDGAGQEILFVFVLFLLSILIMTVNLNVMLKYLKVSSDLVKTSSALKLKILFSVIIVLAVSLEGAEIIIFFESQLSGQGNVFSILLGGVLGLGIGVSVAAVSYYLLSQFKPEGLIICITILSMISAGMASQAITYLMQADLIDNAYPIWSTSAFINERSLLGQLMYALVGYEATPTLLQVCTYTSYLMLPLLVTLYFKKNMATLRKDE